VAQSEKERQSEETAEEVQHGVLEMQKDYPIASGQRRENAPEL
jgi:hypothetical protein